MRLTVAILDSAYSLSVSKVLIMASLSSMPAGYQLSCSHYFKAITLPSCMYHTLVAKATRYLQIQRWNDN